MVTVLITCLHLQRNFAQFKPQYDELGIKAVLPPIPGQQLDAAGMRAHIEDVHVVIAGDDVIDADVLKTGKASKLQAVIKWGIGTDGIDKTAAIELGIPVFNTPSAFSDEVADLAMSHLLMLVRKTHLMHASILKGGWLQVSGRTLAGRTAGIVGLGSIGLGIARRVRAFGMNAVGYDVKSIDRQTLERDAITQKDLDRVLGESDVLFIACNLTPDNRHLISHDALARMPDNSYLINVGRGPLVDQTAVVAALDSNKLAGVGLDVFEEEPVSLSNPLQQFADRCVFSTHCGSNTVEAVTRINQMTSDILFAVLGLKTLTTFTPNRVA